MADYFLDDASNATNDGASWATCYNTWAQVNTAAILTDANRLIVGADANITDPGAALTITGPTSGLPAPIISSTVGSGTTVSYSKGTGNQIDTDSGSFRITFDGSFALYGLKIVSGEDIVMQLDADETLLANDCLFVPGSADSVISSTTGPFSCQLIFENCEFNYSSTTTGSSTTLLLLRANVELLNCSLTNLTNRTGAVFNNGSSGSLKVSGLDMSSAPSTLELVPGGASNYEIGTWTNILTGSTFAGFAAAAFTRQGTLFATNVGPEHAKTLLGWQYYLGSLISSAAIYRSGGGSVEGAATSWLITTTAACGEGAPFYTPWIYGVTTAGEKTFDLFITNDTADFTNAEVWLEVEYLSTEDEPITALASDQRATITATPAAQTDDTTSVWVGLNNSGQGLADFMQKLSVTATVGEAGQYRARVAVGVASIAGSRYFYIDPKVTVS